PRDRDRSRPARHPAAPPRPAPPKMEAPRDPSRREEIDPMEMCQGPRSETKRPKTKVPPKSCDCHMHIFGPDSQYPYTPNRGYTPPEALVPKYFRMLDTLGIERAVVVQASVYGTDNSRTVAAVTEMGLHRARGIGMVERDVDARTLRALADAG